MEPLSLPSASSQLANEALNRLQWPSVEPENPIPVSAFYPCHDGSHLLSMRIV